MNGIIKFFKGVWTFLNSRVFLYVVVIILFLICARACSNYREAKEDLNKEKQNYAASTDSLRIERLKTGELQVSIAGYIASKKELEKLNKTLYDESQKQKGQLLSINQIVFQLKQDTTQLRKHINYLETLISQPIQINDTTYAMDWKLRYDWDSVNYDIYKGRTYIGAELKNDFSWKDGMTNKELISEIKFKHYKTELLEKTSQMELTFGQKIEKNQLRIFVNTNYPGFTPQSLQGVLIDPNTNPYIKQLMKKKQWFPGTFSVGGGPSFGYNVLTGKPYMGIGVSLNYNIFQF